MASRNLNARQPAKNIGANPPTKKTMNADGVSVTEKVCPIPFSRRFIAPDGDNVVVPLANGYTIRGFKGNDYGVQKLEDKLKAGFLPWDECPVATGRVPRSVGDPCLDDRGMPRKFSDSGEPCPHLLKVAMAMREEHRKGQAEYAKRFQTQQDRMLAALEAQTERMAKAEMQPAAKKGISGRDA